MVGFVVVAQGTQKVTVTKSENEPSSREGAVFLFDFAGVVWYSRGHGSRTEDRLYRNNHPKLCHGPDKPGHYTSRTASLDGGTYGLYSGGIMTGFNDYITEEVRHNREQLLERYGGLEGLRKHQAEERQQLEQQDWHFETPEETQLRHREHAAVYA